MRAVEAVLPFNFSIDSADATHVAVAVSGGSDSMALLHLAKRWADGCGTKITAITIDHGLRPESAREARQVRRWAETIGVQHVTLQWQGEKPESGLQAKARDARYALMTKWCAEQGISCLLTGHTENDQAETVAMRMTRTHSADSLAGIRPRLVWNAVAILRPLLHVRRQDLRDWLISIGQDWIDDVSNESDRFERVRVRRLLAETDIETLSGIADASLVQSEAQFAAAQSYLRQYAKFFREGYVSVDVSELGRGFDDTVLSLLLGCIGSGTAILKDRHRLLEWLTHPGGTGRTLGGVIVAKRKSEVLFMREAGRIVTGIATIPASGSLYWDGRFRISGPPGTQIAAVRGASLPVSFPGVPHVAIQSLPMDISGAKEEVVARFEPKLARVHDLQGVNLLNDPARLGIRIDATYVKADRLGSVPAGRRVGSER